MPKDYTIPDFYRVLFRGWGLGENQTEIIEMLAKGAYTTGRIDGMTFAIETLKEPTKFEKLPELPEECFKLSDHLLDSAKQACGAAQSCAQCGGNNGAHFGHCPIELAKPFEQVTGG